MEQQKGTGQKTYEYVFDYFSKQILSGKLRINDRLPTEREIVETLGVSRNSVREVLHMLEISGLIECVQGSGNYVRCDTQEYMVRTANMIMALRNIHYIEVFHLRTAYEYTALNLAITEASDEEVEELHSILEQMDAAETIQESAALDTAFHRTLLRSSHNNLLLLYASMIVELMNQFIADLRGNILVDPVHAESLRETHWNIYRAIAARDVQAGRIAMEQHFEIVDEHLKRYRNAENAQQLQK